MSPTRREFLAATSAATATYLLNPTGATAMTIEQALGEIADAQQAIGTAGTALVQASQALDRAVANLTEPAPTPVPIPVPDPDPLPEPDPLPDPTPGAGRWVTWTEPPRVEVPILTPGQKNRVPVPGTQVDIVFDRVEARPPGSTQAPSCQMAYEHTGAPRLTDPLVSPGDGSHPHEYWGSNLDDIEDLERLWEFDPRFETGSPMAANGGPQTWMRCPATGMPVGHQPGLWHPVWYANGRRAVPGSGSALNYIRDGRVHNMDERLFLPPNGAGWVAFNNRIEWEATPNGKYWRLRSTWDGPTWANRDVWIGPHSTPTERQTNFLTTRPATPVIGFYFPLAKVSIYEKTGTFNTPRTEPKPPLPRSEWGMVGSDIESHIDYTGASVPMKVEGGRVTGVAPDGWGGDTILFGQFVLDATINAHLFGAPAPMYGRWRLEARS